MYVVMTPEASTSHLSRVVQAIEDLGGRPHIGARGEEKIIAAPVDAAVLIRAGVEKLPGVSRVEPPRHPFALGSREFHSPRPVKVGGVVIGGPELVTIAGPCAVESYPQLLEAAVAVKRAGATLLRGGAFKPRTSPYSFRGLGEEGLKILARVGAELELPIVTEVVDTRDAPLVAEYAAMLQIGARNMQNFPLLEAAGKAGRPVLLKRGPSATIEELLLAAEYILASGNADVILCERGIRSFDKITRNILDVTAVPVLRGLTHLPVLIDPSHATGRRDLVLPAALAGVAVGAAGLIVEVHARPEEALSDGPQAVPAAEFGAFMERVRRVAAAR
jgi:3-deoxy-7-phosphoheptulonate synthase